MNFVFVSCLICIVFEFSPSYKVNKLVLAVENDRPSINVTVLSKLNGNQSNNLPPTSLQNVENAPNCSSGSWHSPLNCTELSQVYFEKNSINTSKKRVTALPYNDSTPIEGLSTNSEKANLYGHLANTRTIRDDVETKFDAVGQFREVKKFTSNITSHINAIKNRSIGEYPRMRRVRAENALVHKKLFMEGVFATKPSTRHQNSEHFAFRKKRQRPETETAQNYPNRKTRVTKFPAEFESVLKKVFPDDFVATVRNNNHYGSESKLKKLSGMNIPDGSSPKYKNRNSSNRRQKVKKISDSRFGDESLHFRAADPITDSTEEHLVLTRIVTKIATEVLTDIETYTITAETSPEKQNENTEAQITTTVNPIKSSTEQTGTENTGSGQTGTEKTETGQTGTENTGTGQTGTEKTGTGQTGTEKTEIEQIETSKKLLLSGPIAGTGENGIASPEVNYHFYKFGGFVPPPRN